MNINYFFIYLLIVSLIVALKDKNLTVVALIACVTTLIVELIINMLQYKGFSSLFSLFIIHCMI